MIGGTVIIAIAIGLQIAKVSEKVASLAFGVSTAVFSAKPYHSWRTNGKPTQTAAGPNVDLTLLLRSLLKSETQPSKAREEHHGSFESPFTGRKCNKQQKRC